MKKVLLFLLMSGAASAAVEQLQSDYVSDVLDDRMCSVTQAWGELGVDTAVKPTDGREAKPLRIKDNTYSKGLGHHASGEIAIDLDGDYTAFSAEVGLQHQEANTAGSVVFQVFVDDVLRYDSGLMRQGDEPKKIGVATKGANSLRLVTTDGGDGITCDCADWADARLVRVYPFKGRDKGEDFDMARFARAFTGDPHKTDGARSSRIQEFNAEDVYLDNPLPQTQGVYVVPTERDGAGCVGLQWPEARQLRELGLEFAPNNPVPSTDLGRLEYWTGESPWQGSWKKLNGAITQNGARWTVLVGMKDNPDLPRIGIDKIRWVFSGFNSPILIKNFFASTRARADVATLRVELENPQPGKRCLVEAYNSLFTNGAEPDDPRLYVWDLGAPGRFTIKYVKPKPRKTDRSVLRFHLDNGGCGVSVEDVIKNGGVYVKGVGLYVASATAPMTLAECRDKAASRKTILEQVREKPDQTLEGALAITHVPVQDLGPMLLSLACDNHKVVANRDGVIHFSPLGEPIDDAKGAFAPSHRFITKFGSGKSQDVTRNLRDGWIPAPEITIKEGSVAYRQCAYVTPTGDPLVTAPLWLNGKPLCVVEYAMENQGDVSADISLEFSLTSGDKTSPAEKDGAGVIFAHAGSLLAAIDASGSGALTCSANEGGASLRGRIGAHETVRCKAYMPLWKETPVGFAAPGSPYENLKRYWTEALAGATQIEIPDEFLSNLIKASQVHCLIAARNEQDGRNVAAWISSDRYGPLESEAHSVILGMDLMGQGEFARRSLDYFVKRYNPRGYLTTGYTLMGTGWHLWTLARHWQLTADKQWFDQVAPNVSAACQWIGAQTDKTRVNLNPEVYPEIGLFPPGVAADWNRFAYRFAIQGHFYAGLHDAANALADIKFPTANRLLEIASEYKKNILRAYHWNQTRTPAWALLNGAYVPAYPGMLYNFGETGEMIPGEDGNRSWAYDVEVGAHHLIPLGVLDPNSADVANMMDHMEDIWFLHSGMGEYPSSKNHEDWFDFGGFSKVQPYYTRNAEIYAARDDVKPFIRSYFNALASLVSRENLSFWEHFHNTGGWNKTHETGWFLVQTRAMCVDERGDELWLAPFLPCAWLENGKTASVKNAPTKFGPVNFRITSNSDKGYIEAEIDPPTRVQPKAIVARLRHPQGLPMKSVTVNGAPIKDFDPAKECVRITNITGPISIHAEY